MQSAATPPPIVANPMGRNPQLLWAPRAWLGVGAAAHWAEGVCLEVDASGHWKTITSGIHTPPITATVLAGPAVPGMADAHSHAFQRAFAGLAERRASDADDFWSWRDRMYGVALRTTPAQLRAIATQLYLELLQGGYTQVCEFHYLHHQPDGRQHPDPAAMAWALADAAQDAGIGLTVLPVLYERAGFAQPSLRQDQRRFASTPSLVAELQRSVQRSGRALLNAGVAIHSLRAASSESIAALRAELGDADLPIHIHVAEQMQEVRDCLLAHGQRPVAWLAAQGLLDARWQLVHATHTEAAEIDAVARSGAGIVICPSTEANLGDGVADMPGWLDANVPMAIGSDSQVCRQWAEELRWLEYGQRLQLQRRNVAAAPTQGQSATAARLFDAAIRAGGPAAGFARWGLQVGARADVVVLKDLTPGLLGVPASHTLDALVFACDSPTVRDVFVAGQAVIREGQHARQAPVAAQFVAAMDALWQGAVLE